MSDFRYEIKRNFLTCYLTEILTENPGWSVRNEHKLILILGWSGRWWIFEDRPRTDPPTSSMSDLELVEDPRPQTSGFKLDSTRLETPLRPALFSVSAQSLIETPFGPGSGPDSDSYQILNLKLEN